VTFVHCCIKRSGSPPGACADQLAELELSVRFSPPAGESVDTFLKVLAGLLEGTAIISESTPGGASRSGAPTVSPFSLGNPCACIPRGVHGTVRPLKTSGILGDVKELSTLRADKSRLRPSLPLLFRGVNMSSHDADAIGPGVDSPRCLWLCDEVQMQ